MNERIRELAEQAVEETQPMMIMQYKDFESKLYEKFAELIVKEMSGLMEQAADDAYHCFEPSERPAQYIEWLQNWQERFASHFGVK